MLERASRTFKGFNFPPCRDMSNEKSSFIVEIGAKYLTRFGGNRPKISSPCIDYNADANSFARSLVTTYPLRRHHMQIQP